tara:strand:- start:5666 stop:6682 length:1017 start_codon:yes stop_codon:yes gene_type:complete
MNSSILILAYPNTDSKLDNLKILLKKLKTTGYDICVSTHIPLPVHIQSLCKYVIYDDRNELIYDFDMKYYRYYKYKSEDNTSTIIPHFKSITDVSTHAIPYFLDQSNGINFLKNHGYKKIHLFDFDIITHSTEEIINNNSLLDDHGLITYSCVGGGGIKHNITTYIAINLEKTTYTTFNRDKVLGLYKEYFEDGKFPIIENIVFSESFSTSSPLNKDVSTIEKYFTTHTEVLGDGDEELVHLRVKDGELIIFDKNSKITPSNLDLIVYYRQNKPDGVEINKTFTYSTSNLPVGHWMDENLGVKLEDVKSIKVFKNDSHIRTFDMDNVEDRKYIIEGWR